MFASLSTQELETEITELAAQIAADTCRWLLLVAEFDRRQGHLAWGFHCCSLWIAWRCSVAPRAAREQLRVARRLTELPLVRKAFARGELSYSKVRALTRVEDPAVEADLLELARHATAAQVERIVRSFRGVLDLEDARAAIVGREFSYSWEEDGSLRFHGRLAPEEGALLLRALEAGRAMTNDADPGQDDPGQELPRAGASEAADDRVSGTDRRASVLAKPRTQPRASNADAVVTMAESLLANGAATRSAGERHEVVVHVDAATLAGEGDRRGGEADGGLRCCELENGPAISAETARRLSCDAAVVPMLEGPDGTLHVGRRTRTIPPSIRRALRSRDRGCRFPGCPNHRWTDGHHIEHWGNGGETSIDNLVLLCRHHHRLVHEEGFTIERRRDGTLEFRRPDGHRLPNSPRLRPRDQGSCTTRTRRSFLAETAAPGPLAIGAGEAMDLHLAIAGLANRSRPREPAKPGDGDPRRDPPNR
jgi:hypothetical protein